jgi:hypothetical protein
LQKFGHASCRLPDMIESADLAVRNGILSRDHAAQHESGPDAMELANRSTLLTLLLSATSYTQSSDPYGNDDWDILWLGHCGTSLPTHRNPSASGIPPDRFMLLNDATVSDPDSPHPATYPPHTRICHRSYTTRCIHAYAISQRGARKFMYEHGMRNLDKDYGSALSEWCDWTTKHMGDGSMCLTRSPSIFGHYALHGNLKENASEDTVVEEKKEGYLMKSVRESLSEGLDDEEG